MLLEAMDQLILPLAATHNEVFEWFDFLMKVMDF